MVYCIENLLSLIAFRVFLSWGRAYVSTAYLSSKIHFRILLSSFLSLVRQRKVLPIRSHLPLLALSILQVFRLPFWTSLCVPSVQDKVASILSLHSPLITSLMERFPTYLTHRQKNLQTYVEVLEVFILFWWIIVGIVQSQPFFQVRIFVLSVYNYAHPARWTYCALILEALIDVHVNKGFFWFNCFFC